MSEFIMLKKVRVSFPHFFTRPVIDGDEGAFGGVFMLEPDTHKKTIDAVDARIAELIKDKWRGKLKSLPSEKLCLRDGEDKARPEYEGYMVLSANKSARPTVLASDGRTTILDEEDSPIYAGCYVNAKVRLWAQDNKWGKRVNAELIAVQFAGNGEPLDNTYVSHDDAVEGFGDTSDEEEDDFLDA